MKINKQIAESLASKVAAQLKEANAKRFSKVKSDIENSKEFKKITSLRQKYFNLKEELHLLEDQIGVAKKEFLSFVETKKDKNTEIYSTYLHSDKSYSISVNPVVCRQDIVDDIMIEAAFADSGMSSEEFMEKITKKYI